MMGYRVTALSAREILDSRSRPTLEVTIELDSGTVGRAAVPSGASTGTKEAVERRDGDRSRYGGAGVQSVVATVDSEIAEHLVGRRWRSLAEVDEALCQLDGTPNKARLGANAIIGVSMAMARAQANADHTELYRRLIPDGVAARLPVPHFNVINGGLHAKNRLAFQEFMVAPIGAPTFAEALRAGAEVYATLYDLLDRLGFSTGLGDEGGFAPAIEAPTDALDFLVEAIETAGYPLGREGVAIALDPAASSFRDSNGRYRINGSVYDADELVDYLESLLDRYPIWSIEDGVGEDDEKGWRLLTQRLGDRIQIVGDDSLCTNPATISDAISESMGNAALLKVNQVGTVTETLDAARRCREAGWGAMVSHRSGETADSFIADLAVAIGCGQIKSGAPARGERVAKYNRLMAIESSGALPYGLPPHPVR